MPRRKDQRKPESLPSPPSNIEQARDLLLQLQRIPTFHQHQQTIYDNKTRFKVVCCGRRFGKTQLAVQTITERALAGQAVAYMAPTYNMMMEVWRELKTVLHPFFDKEERGRYRTEKKEDERRIGINGGVIKLWSLSNFDLVRGQRYDYVVIDEAAVVPRLAEAWEYVVRATLLDSIGDALFLSTPKGRNYFWQLYSRGADAAYTDWAAFQYVTADNPHIPADEVLAAERELPERVFQQEYLAKFLTDAGEVFRGVEPISTLETREPFEGQFVFGVDWARKHDFTVISVLDAKTKQQVAVERFNQISWTLQRGRLAAFADQWQPALILAEANSMGEPMIEALQAEGYPVEPFMTTQNSKARIVDGLALAIERAELGLLEDAVQMNELQTYTVERGVHGALRYNAPHGGHDDMVMALALAWEALQLSSIRANPLIWFEA